MLEELNVNGLDVNTPDSSKRLALVEAVRSKDKAAVLALLELGAVAKAHEPSSGTTALHVAFKENLPGIARLLLAHGADPAVVSYMLRRLSPEESRKSRHAPVGKGCTVSVAFFICN